MSGAGVTENAGGRGGHLDHEFHHHHSHGARARHEGGHHLLAVERLSVAFDRYDPNAPFFRAGRVRTEVLHDLSLSVHAGEILAVVGASGSGKTVLADTLTALFEPNAEVRGRIWFEGAERDAASLARLRGHGISMVPQSVAYLDPLMRVGAQVRGVPRGTTRAERAEDAARRRARQQEFFAAYGLTPEVERFYPHQLSGGMARRVLLMCALMDEPRLLIADEPTPGLDLDLAVRAVDDLRAFANGGGGVLLVAHDIELALRVADRVAVFRDGTVVEETSVESFADPSRLRHPFTRALWHALPGHDFSVTGEGAPATPAPSAGPGPSGQPVLEARHLTFAYRRGRPVIRDLSFVVNPGERVALEAPSGAGKTTLCRLLAGYLEPDAGDVLVGVAPLVPVARLRGEASPVQLLWQHPEQVFDPNLRLGMSLGEAGAPSAVLDDLRARLGVRDAWLERFPHELSGGELTRLAVVRALAARPRALIVDEATAMLDALTQAQVWHALLELQVRDGWGLVFVSHSPDLVARLATRHVQLA